MIDNQYSCSSNIEENVGIGMDTSSSMAKFGSKNKENGCGMGLWLRVSEL